MGTVRDAASATRDQTGIFDFITVAGTRLRYFESGTGKPVVLLHGNGSMIEDFDTSGLIELASNNHRVIAFDRPGFGHTERPRNVVWSQAAQADLIGRALARLGVTRPLVLGHSWGASVAVALALQYPNLVQGLVLVSGYYYPTLRPDFVILSALPSHSWAISWHTVSHRS
jgi:pimeloyl-ACP methyl ester carboxylesterase